MFVADDADFGHAVALCAGEHACDGFVFDELVRADVKLALVGGIGLTLTRARYSLYYSNTFSIEDRIQVENRNHRTGQDQHTVHVDFEAMVKEDRMITRALTLKKSLGELVKSSIEKTNAGRPSIEQFMEELLADERQVNAT